MSQRRCFPSVYPVHPNGFTKSINSSDIRPPLHPHMLRYACGFSLANKGVYTRALQQGDVLIQLIP